MKSAPLVRACTMDDISTLAPLLAPMPLFARYGLNAMTLGLRWEKALADKHPMLVAEHAGAPVGLCWHAPRGAFMVGGYLRLLAVSTQAQGIGAGAALLRAYEDASESPIGGWFLLTSDFNTGAQAFYEHHGYKQVGRVPDFLVPGIAEIIYWKARTAASAS